MEKKNQWREGLGRLGELAEQAGVLFGIGVGPGDAGLLTLAGYRVLQQVDLVVVPVKKAGKSSVAYQIVQELIPTETEVLEQVYPMSYDPRILDQAWEKNQQEIGERLQRGQSVAFLTLGDPFVYSTYSYIYQRLVEQGFDIQTINGVTSFQAASSRAGRPLVQGEERLAVLPGTRDVEELARILELFDTVVILKVNRALQEIYPFLEKENLLGRSYLVSNLGLAEERVCTDLTELAEQEGKLPYLTTLIIQKGSDQR